MSERYTFNSVEDVQEQAKRMYKYFIAAKTVTPEFRIEQLQKLRNYISEHEDEILEALNKDLGKSPFEGLITEIGMVYSEIDLCIKNLATWVKPEKKKSPKTDFHTKSYTMPFPLGTVLVIAPWNLPFQMSMVPLVEAIAAGNCVALKPSRKSLHTSMFVVDMIGELFPQEYVCALPSGENMNKWMLEVRWDAVFFAGSKVVGRKIMAKVGEFLTPVVMELNSKSPAVVGITGNVSRAAERIAYGKGINAGQTSAAPDYVLVHKDVADEFVEKLEKAFIRYYGKEPLKNDEWPHIINRDMYDAKMALLENLNPNAVIAFGGHGDPETLRIEPTAVRYVKPEDELMTHTIFAPILPIIEYATIDDAIEIIRKYDKPMAVYLFSDDQSIKNRFTVEIPFGGMSINDTMTHPYNINLPFGGIGDSGLGIYHGKYGFDSFSHVRGIMESSTASESKLRIPPFKNKIDRLRKYIH